MQDTPKTESVSPGFVVGGATSVVALILGLAAMHERLIQPKLRESISKERREDIERWIKEHSRSVHSGSVSDGDMRRVRESVQSMEAAIERLEATR